jgi:hypothetical protein
VSEPAPLRRYVVLHHWGIDAPHFDFLFETTADAPLMTFRLSEWPLTKDQPVTRLRDHRRVYLTFQGEIPGDRGRVDRVAEGVLQVIETGSGWLLRTPQGEFIALFEPRGEPHSNIPSGWWVTFPRPGPILA